MTSRCAWALWLAVAGGLLACGGGAGGGATGDGDGDSDGDLSCDDDGALSEDECAALESNPSSCQAFGYGQGTARCDDACRVDRTGCSTCGDGVVEGEEVCDGDDLGGATCASEGLDDGELRCSADCASVQTYRCGNGELVEHMMGCNYFQLPLECLGDGDTLAAQDPDMSAAVLQSYLSKRVTSDEEASCVLDTPCAANPIDFNQNVTTCLWLDEGGAPNNNDVSCLQTCASDFETCTFEDCTVDGVAACELIRADCYLDNCVP